MTAPVNIIAQYLTGLHVDIDVPPYQVKARLAHGIGVKLDFTRLPQDYHWRVTLAVTAEAKADEVRQMAATVSLEAIAVVQAEDDDTARAALTASVAPLLFATARAQLANATMTTGYGPVHLPPLPAEKLKSLVPANA